MAGVKEVILVLFLLGVFATVIYTYGERQRYLGRKELKNELALQAVQARAATVQEIEELKDEIDLLSDDDFLSRLGEWVREPRQDDN